MKNHFVDVFDLARKGASLEGELALADLSRFAQDLPEQNAQVHWQVQGEYNASGQLFLTVNAQSQAMLVCQRCLVPFSLPLVVANRLELVPADTELGDDDEPEQIERIAGDTRFDLLALIEDELILAVPYVPVHEVCPQEALPASEPEPVQEDKRPSPFAVLGKLKPPQAD